MIICILAYPVIRHNFIIISGTIIQAAYADCRISEAAIVSKLSTCLSQMYAFNCIGIHVMYNKYNKLQITITHMAHKVQILSLYINE